MTVSELIIELQKYVPTLSVNIDDSEYGPDLIERVSEETVKLEDGDYKYLVIY